MWYFAAVLPLWVRQALLACRLLEVAESRCYKWRNRSPSQPELRQAFLLEQIRAIHAASRGTYGAFRVDAEGALAGLGWIGPAHWLQPHRAAGSVGGDWMRRETRQAAPPLGTPRITRLGDVPVVRPLSRLQSDDHYAAGHHDVCEGSPSPNITA